MRAIYFDLGGTLLEETTEYREVLQTTFETYQEAFVEGVRNCAPEPYRRAFTSIDESFNVDGLVEQLLENEISSAEPV